MNFEQVKLAHGLRLLLGAAPPQQGFSLVQGMEGRGQDHGDADAGEARQCWGRKRAGWDECPTGQREVATSIGQVGDSGSPG